MLTFEKENGYQFFIDGRISILIGDNMFVKNVSSRYFFWGLMILLVNKVSLNLLSHA